MRINKDLKKYDKYKDSGIEWIGEFPQDWNIRKLFGLLDTIGSGTTPKGNDNYYDGQIGWLNTGDLNDSFIYNASKTITDLAMEEYSTLKVFNAGSVVIALYGATIGKLGILQIPTTTNQACCVMSCNALLNNKYLFYSLYSARDYILTLSYGSGQPNISQETMKSFKLCTPSIDEQQQIVDYLDKKCGKIDRVVETQKDLIEKLKEYKQSIITEAVTKGLDKSTPLKDSGIEWIGKIPQHWEVCRLKNYAKIQNGQDFKFVEDDNGSIPVIGSGGEFALANKYLYNGESVLLGRKGTIDKPLYVKCAFWTVDTMYYTQLENITFGKYFYYLCKTINFDFYQYGSAVPSMTQRDLNSVQFPLPRKDEQKQIADYLDKKCSEIDFAISEKKQLIEKLTEYKKSLIYECVTGKRKVVTQCHF